MWGVLGQRFRGQPKCHEVHFMAVANLTQFLIHRVGYDPEDEEELALFEVE